VNPEALTPWKAEMLWQLYAATENYLNRSVDDQRLYVAGEDAKQLEHLVLPGQEGAETGAIPEFSGRFSEAISPHSPLRRKSRLTTGCINVWDTLRRKSASPSATITTSLSWLRRTARSFLRKWLARFILGNELF